MAYQHVAGQLIRLLDDMPIDTRAEPGPLTDAEWEQIERLLAALWRCRKEKGYDWLSGKVRAAVDDVIRSRS